MAKTHRVITKTREDAMALFESLCRIVNIGDRKVTVLWGYFFAEKTLKEIGKELNPPVCPERTRQIRDRGLAEIANALRVVDEMDAVFFERVQQRMSALCGDFDET